MWLQFLLSQDNEEPRSFKSCWTFSDPNASPYYFCWCKAEGILNFAVSKSIWKAPQNNKHLTRREKSFSGAQKVVECVQKRIVEVSLSKINSIYVAVPLVPMIIPPIHSMTIDLSWSGTRGKLGHRHLCGGPRPGHCHTIMNNYRKPWLCGCQ